MKFFSFRCELQQELLVYIANMGRGKVLTNVEKEIILKETAKGTSLEVITRKKIEILQREIPE